jgi:arylsulfatase
LPFKNFLVFIAIFFAVFAGANQIATALAEDPAGNPAPGFNNHPAGAVENSLTTAAGIGEKKPDAPNPNILLIIIDTLRADHLGCYGAEFRTPAIDAIASNGVLFESAYTQIPITLPSHTAIFTGRYPFKTGVFNNSEKVDDSLLLLAEILDSAGYRNASVVSLGTVQNITNIGQGFDFYEDNFYTWFRRAEEVTNTFKETLFNEISKDRSWFVFLHFSDPHEPYHAHGAWKNQVKMVCNGKDISEKNVSDQVWSSVDISLDPGINHLKITGEDFFKIRDLAIDDKRISWKIDGGKEEKEWHSFGPSKECLLILENHSGLKSETCLHAFISDCPDIERIRIGYRKEVEYVDRNVGEIMREFEIRGQLENTIVIFSSDHGESLGEHGNVGHIHTLYNPSIRVPLIISYSGRLPNSKRINENIRLIDILPTILELSNIEHLPEMDGQSLLPLIEGKEKNARPVLSMTFRPEAQANLAAIVQDKYKLVRNLDNGETELFDLESDPGELKDLKATDLLLLNRMKKRLMDVLGSTGFSESAIEKKTDKVHLDQKRRRALEALGYIR